MSEGSVVGLIKDPFSFGWQQKCFKPIQVLLDILMFNSGLGNLLDGRCERLEPVAIIWELLLRSHGLENSCIEKLRLILHS